MSQITIANRDEIVAEVCIHFLVMRVLGEIGQFSEGLKETLQFDHLIKVSSIVLCFAFKGNYHIITSIYIVTILKCKNKFWWGPRCAQFSCRRSHTVSTLIYIVTILIVLLLFLSKLS